jgi:uncharacterized protein (TIGR02246 family)
MKKILIAIIFTLSVLLPAFAQKDDAKDVLAVVDKMFAEMANHNPAAIAELFTKDSNLTALIKRKDGKTAIAAFTGEAFSKNFAEKKGEIKEDMYEHKTLIDGDLAMIWGRYVFFVDGKISHCGLNSFHLVRTETGWRIANASSTIDATGCNEKEKAMKISMPAKQN